MEIADVTDKSDEDLEEIKASLAKVGLKATVTKKLDIEQATNPQDEI